MSALRSLSGVSAALVLALSTATPAFADPPPVDVLAPGYPMGNNDAAGEQGSTCTVGFVTHNPKGTPVLMEAGHCDEGGQETIFYRATGDWEPVGSYLVNMYSPPWTETSRDMGAVPLKDSQVPVSSALLGRTPITGAAIPAVGQQLCTVGSYSGTTCGKVTRVTATKVYFDAYSREGDSSGPVYLDNGDGTVTAVGVSSGGPVYECEVDKSGEHNCGGGYAIAELIVPWMQQWSLTIP